VSETKSECGSKSNSVLALRDSTTSDILPVVSQTTDTYSL